MALPVLTAPFAAEYEPLSDATHPQSERKSAGGEADWEDSDENDLGSCERGRREMSDHYQAVERSDDFGDALQRFSLERESFIAGVRDSLQLEAARTSSNGNDEHQEALLPQTTTTTTTTTARGSDAAKPPPSAAKFSLTRTLLAYLPNTRYTTALVTTLILQGTISIALQTHIGALTDLRKFIAKDALKDQGLAVSGSAAFIYTSNGSVALLVTVTFESVYQIVLSLDAVRRRNIVQTIGVCVNNGALITFVALGWVMVKRATEADEGLLLPLDWPAITRYFSALLAVLGVSTGVLGWIAWRLAGEFAWAIYRHISAANIQLRRRYLLFEIYMAFLHLDMFFLTGIWIQAATVFPTNGFLITFPGSIVAAVLTLIQLWLAGSAASRESRVRASIAIAFFVADIAYIGFVLWEMYDSPQQMVFAAQRQRMTAYMILALPLLAGSIAMTVLVMMNFGRGLKQHLQARRILADAPRNSAAASRGWVDEFQMRKFGNRMEIE